MPQALAGIRVVDFSHVVAGPLATHFLALNGAEVIKVEPARGDALRNYTLDQDLRGKAPAFEGINVGKKSVVLDLKSDEGKEAALALIDTADVVVENFRPGVMDRLGLGYDVLSKRNPQLIYCAVSGFGQSGDLANLPAIDQIVQSLSGLMYLSGQKDDPAIRVGIPIVDTFTGLLAAFAIQTALVQRERAMARGQFIDVAMLDATLVMMMSVVNPLLLAGERPARTGNLGFSQAPTADTFATKDGEITIGAVEDVQVARLLDVLGLAELLEDPQFRDRSARVQNGAAMRRHLAAVLVTGETGHWETALQQANVPAARVQRVEDAVAMPHLAAREVFQPVGPSGRKVLNAGFQFQTGGPTVPGPAPDLGQDTDEILAAAGMQRGKKKMSG